MENRIDIEQLLGEQHSKVTEKQIQIIEAATTLFAQKGYAATSTKEIAALAHVAEGTIFKQYATKEDLFLTIMQMTLQNILYPVFSTGIDELVQKEYASLEEALQTFLQNRLMILKSGTLPLLAVKMVIQELPYWPAVQEQLAELLRQVPIEALIVRLQQQGLIVQWPPQTVSKLLLSAMMGFLSTRFLLLPQYFAGNLEQDMEYWVRLMTKALAVEGSEGE